MSKLVPEIAPDVVAQCQMAAGEIGQAFGRAFETAVENVAGETVTQELGAVAHDLSSAGLAILLHIGDGAAAILVPAAGKLLPPWYNSADPKEQSKLTTLAQELGMLVLPEAYMAEDVQAIPVPNLSSALDECGVDAAAGVVRLSLKCGDTQAPVLMVWPLTSPRAITRANNPANAAQAEKRAPPSSPEVDESAPTTETDAEVARDVDQLERLGEAQSDVQAASEHEVGTVGRATPSRPPSRGPSLRDLPSFTRSLLKIRVPLSVTLAEKKQPVGQILEIGPGSILQFDKSCEEMLDLNVSNLPVARGETVKVGDKFGIRVTSLILPGERFKSVRPSRQ